jgi:hypothetical protein
MQLRLACLCASFFAFFPVCANAAIETDPTALHAIMEEAYERGNEQHWSFNDQLYYESAVFAAGRSYSLFARENPNYPGIAAMTIDVASALHYDPLSNDDASEWWVREAATFIAANDPRRAPAASALIARLNEFDGSPEAAARIADSDAAANVVSYHKDVWARVAQVVVDLRAYRYARDSHYAQAALERAVDPTFPLINLSDVASERLYDYAASVKDYAILRRRDATAQLREIGHVNALSHHLHLSITAPADEYFGPSKLSVLGIRNEIEHLEAYLRAGWGSRLVDDARNLAGAVEELHRVYPRDFELPRLFVRAAGVLEKIPSAETEARARSLRRTLVVEYPDSPQSRALL